MNFLSFFYAIRDTVGASEHSFIRHYIFISLGPYYSKGAASIPYSKVPDI